MQKSVDEELRKRIETTTLNTFVATLNDFARDLHKSGLSQADVAMLFTKPYLMMDSEDARYEMMQDVLGFIWGGDPGNDTFPSYLDDGEIVLRIEQLKQEMQLK